MIDGFGIYSLAPCFDDHLLVYTVKKTYSPTKKRPLSQFRARKKKGCLFIENTLTHPPESEIGNGKKFTDRNKKQRRNRIAIVGITQISAVKQFNVAI